jgi:photosystem II stability/assembly factor-like uncharacterized protein
VAGAVVVAAVVGAMALIGALAAPAAALAMPAANLTTGSPAASPTLATAAWVQISDPYPSPGPSPRAIATFGSAGVAVVGSDGTIALSTNGGITWTQPTLPGGAAVQAVAFSDASDGWAVGSSDTIVVTTDGGASWQVAATAAGTDDFDAVAVAQSPGLALALSPSLLLNATDAATPVPEATALALPASPSAIVAGPNGFAAATGADGALVTRNKKGAWTQQTAFSNPVVGLALAPAPVWAHGTPDLFAVGASGVQGSDDQGVSFTALPAPPGPHRTPAQLQLSAAFLGSPTPQLLVGGQGGLLERYELSNGAWVRDSGPLTGDIVSCAAGPGGVAYALAADGHVERTLSYGVAPLALSASTTSVTATGDVQLTAASSVRAPGTLILEAQAAGEVWQRVAAWPWSTSPAPVGGVIDEPLSTTQYRLRFVFAGDTAATSAVVTVGVRPHIGVARTSLRLRKGAAYRLTGHVFPAQPGRKVAIWTNRGGTWHRIAKGGIVTLAGGTSYATRLFGTPIRESYRLQVRLGGNAAYLPATSALVKVTIR